MEASTQVRGAVGAVSRRRRLAIRPSMALCAAVAAWAAIPLLTLAGKTLLSDRSPTGAFGVKPLDQLQYLAWIRQAGDHGFISNLFTIGPSEHVFFHPFFSLSGILWRLGVPLQLSYLVWLPVTLAVLLYGVWSYLRRMLPEGPSRWAAFVLVFFIAPPIVPLLDVANVGLNSESLALLRPFGYELTTAGFLWDYLPKALAIGLMPLVFIAAERAVHVRGSMRRKLLAAACGGALAISWLHPWQGVTLILVLGAVLVWDRFSARKRALVAIILAAAAPLLYYFALSHTNDDWATASLDQWPSLGPMAWVGAAIGFAPFLALAAFGVRKPREMQEKILILWPIACACTLLVPGAGWFYAPAGASIPLAILMVRGWRSLSESARARGWRLGPVVAVALIAFVTVPTAIRFGQLFHRQVTQAWFMYYMEPGERQALSYLEDSPERGGVFPTPLYGAVASSMTGRQSWSGHFAWTPHFSQRQILLSELWSGQLTHRQVRVILQRSGATFVVADCRFPPPVTMRLLGDAVTPVRTFGCAGVYRINGAPGT